MLLMTFRNTDHKIQKAQQEKFYRMLEIPCFRFKNQLNNYYNYNLITLLLTLLQ